MGRRWDQIKADYREAWPYWWPGLAAGAIALLVEWLVKGRIGN